MVGMGVNLGIIVMCLKWIVHGMRPVGQCLAKVGKNTANVGQSWPLFGRLWPVFGHNLASLNCVELEEVGCFGQYFGGFFYLVCGQGNWVEALRRP
jgi:hypothetical protein